MRYDGFKNRSLVSQSIGGARTVSRVAAGRNPLDVFVGKRLQMKRVADGLSQADLASAIRMPREWIAAYENGDERILPAHLARFCDLFDVNPSFFFEGL